MTDEQIGQGHSNTDTLDSADHRKKTFTVLKKKNSVQRLASKDFFLKLGRRGPRRQTDRPAEDGPPSPSMEKENKIPTQ